LDDAYASANHARLLREAGGWVVLDEGSRNGTFVDGRRLEPGERRPLPDPALLEVGHTFFFFRPRSRGSTEAAPLLEAGEPLTFCPEWELELHRALKLAAGLSEVLLQGESGAGKEVLAQFLHERADRPGPLIAVNCAALPEALLEDELFGHVKGAFSGALSDRAGLIRAADRGTLLLDEIGDMPAVLQVKLLRVIEDRVVRPLGSERGVEVDVRVIAATNHNLAELVTAGRFREELLARLGLVSVRVPALRERREDLGLIVRGVLQRAGVDLRRVRFELEALSLLLRHRWPLNVRELRRSLLAALELARVEGAEAITIAPHHLPEAVRAVPQAAPGIAEPRTQAIDPAGSELRDRLLALLQRTGGNTAAVARELGKSRSWVQRSMQRLGVDRRAAAALPPDKAGR
jgi:DNA-binding NtrC family response regulator